MTTDTNNLVAGRRGQPAFLILYLIVPATFLLCFSLPWWTSFATLRLAVEILTIFTVAMAWNLLAGFGGLVAIGQHMFVGVGAYALFAVSNKLEISPWLALPFAAFASAVFALACAMPLFRLNGAYFAVGTWVLAEMLRILALNSAWLGAGMGMPLEAMIAMGRWARNAGVYWSALTLGLGTLVAAQALLRGRLGLALVSVRDSEMAAAASGVAVTRAKLTLWVIAGTLTGLAGSVAYMSTLQVTPDASFSLNWTAAAIFIVVLGGVGTFEGPIIGTIIYFGMRETLSIYGAWYFIGLGLLATLTMIFAPRGAWGFVAERWKTDVFAIRHAMPNLSSDHSNNGKSDERHI